MLKSRDALIALAMVSALALTACGGAAKSTAQPAAVPPAATAQSQSPMEAGVAAMRQVLADAQKAVAAGDAAKAQAQAKAVDAAWEKFEDQARDKSKDLYAKIEDQIQLIQAATKATPMDSKIAGDAGAKLNALLDELVSGKSDPAAALKDGVAAMKHDLDGAQKAIDAGDAAKAQQAVTAADEAWEQFEDQVKAKNKDLYAKAEDQLHAIAAAVKATPLDAKVAAAAITKLNTYLDRVPALAGDIPAGVAWLKHEVEGTNSAVTAGDAVKARKEAEEADQAWESFEDQAKAKNKELYGQIEAQLQALQAAVKPNTIDAKAVGTMAGKLGGLLDDLLK